MIKHKQFNAFALPLVIFMALLLAIGACSDDDTTTAASLPHTNDDGVAELTHVPSLPTSLSISDTAINVGFQVDSDTAKVDVYLHPVGDSTTTIASVNDQAVTASATNSITMGIFTAPTVGTNYYIELIACASATATCQFGVTSSANDTGYADDDPTTGVYLKFQMNDFSNATNTGVGIPTITAN